jgi:hypothetical protein
MKVLAESDGHVCQTAAEGSAMIAAIYAGTLKRMRSRNRVWVVIVWVTVALARNGWAQPNVDFSGTWTLDAAKSASPAGIRRGGGTMHIEQTNTELRISTTDPQNGVQTTIVKLDGSDSVSDFFGVGTSTTSHMGRAEARCSRQGDGCLTTGGSRAREHRGVQPRRVGSHDHDHRTNPAVWRSR